MQPDQGHLKREGHSAHKQTKWAHAQQFQTFVTQATPHVQVWDVKQEDAARASTIQDAGHQSGIRAAALSGDDTLLLTVAAEGVKVCASCSAMFSTHHCPAEGLCDRYAA